MHLYRYVQYPGNIVYKTFCLDPGLRGKKHTLRRYQTDLSVSQPVRLPPEQRAWGWECLEVPLSEALCFLHRSSNGGSSGCLGRGPGEFGRPSASHGAKQDAKRTHQDISQGLVEFTSKELSKGPKLGQAEVLSCSSLRSFPESAFLVGVVLASSSLLSLL